VAVVHATGLIFLTQIGRWRLEDKREQLRFL